MKRVMGNAVSFPPTTAVTLTAYKSGLITRRVNALIVDAHVEGFIIGTEKIALYHYLRERMKTMQIGRIKGITAAEVAKMWIMSADFCIPRINGTHLSGLISPDPQSFVLELSRNNHGRKD